MAKFCVAALLVLAGCVGEKPPAKTDPKALEKTLMDLAAFGEKHVGTDGAALSEGWPWVGLLAVFAVAFGAGGALAFGPLIEEAN